MIVVVLAPGALVEEVFRFGPYHAMGVIGEGGMGVVYRARHEETGSIVALKTVRLPTGSELAGIRAEVRALASLRHPGIIRIVGEGVQDGSPWYAMELLEGRTLAAFRAELWRPEVEKATYHEWTGSTVGNGGQRSAGIGGAFAPPPLLRDGVRLPLAAGGRLTEVLGIVRQLCASLAQVHGSGLVHRDLKPSNVFLCRDGRVVLMDFGLAAFHRGAGGRERLEVAGNVVGTVAFMPPEQLRREFVDARADLYALGCVLYELVTGRIPFDGQSWQEVSEQHLCAPVVPPSVLIDGLPPALDGLVVRLLGKQPQNRVGYAEDVVAALQPFLPRPGPDALVPELRSRPYLYRPRLAGRREELGALVAALDVIAAGAPGGVILVGGESGAGKTFLVSELARQSTLRKIQVITGECLPLVGDATVVDAPEAPLHPLRPFLRAVADRCAGFRDEAERILGFRGKLLAPYAPELLGLPGQDAYPEPEPLPLEAARTRLLSALTDVLAAFASSRPLVLVLDDLQWGDELTIALLASLGNEQGTRLPLLIVGTYRSEDDTRALRPLLDGARVQRLALARLDERTMATLAADMLGTAGLPGELTDFLIRTTEGNPFFLAEYLRAAVAEGLLVREAGVWRAQAPEGGGRFEALALPRSLRALVDHRLASMSAGARRVAAVAALLGREAELPVLARMLEQSPEILAELLGELVARQVLELPGGGETYRFVHDKLREAALDTLLADERAAFHLRAAEAIEGCTGDRDLYRLAHHYRLGRRSDKAFHYLYRAGRQALGAGGFGEAHEHLGAAVAIADAHPGSSLAEVAAPLDRARLLRLYAETVLAKGTPGPAAEALFRAFHALEVGRLPASPAGWAWLTLRQLGRQVVHRVAPPSWLEAAPPRRPALEEAARIANALGYAYLVGARREFLGAMLLAAHLADRSRAAGERALAYSALGSIVGTFGLWRMAGAFFRLARGGDLSHGARAGRTLMAVQEAMWLHYRRGDFAALEACVEPALAWCKAQGLVNDSHLLSVIRSHALLDTGALGAARERLEEHASRAASLGDRLGAGWASEGLGPCYLALGRLREAVDSCARREAEVRAVGAEADLFLPAATAALALLRLGERERAEATAAEALARLRSGPDLVSRPFALKALADLAEVLVVLAETTGDASTARALRDQATAVGRSLSRYARRFAYLRPGALRIEARLAELRGKGGQAVALLEASLRAATELAMAPAEAMARLELGRQPLPPDAQRAHLERARAAFEAMDQRWHLVTARAALLELDR